MATYNGAKYLKEQIDSLLRQKDVEVRILVRDDGSSDSTTTILDEYQSRGLLQWYANGHKNVQKGFLDLCKHALEADYYAFCDQDDVWDDDKLAIATRHLSLYRDGKPAIYYCGQRLVDENLSFIKDHYISNKRTTHSHFLKTNVAGCTLVFNKPVLTLLNRKSPDFILMHDIWTFKVCVSTGGHFIIDPTPHISYRQHSNNTVGLNGGLYGKIRLLKHYWHSPIYKQSVSLWDNYHDLMTPEYERWVRQIIDYNKSWRNKILLAFSSDVSFETIFLDILVKFKILFSKL